MSNSVLVGVDGSETALTAARKAARLAQALNADLLIVMAYGVSARRTVAGAYVSKDAEVEERRAHMTDEVRELAAAAELVAENVGDIIRAEFPDVVITTRSVEGDPADVLVYEADRGDFEIIVVGNKRVQGPGRILGSIARSVAAATSRDLYVANTHAR